MIQKCRWMALRTGIAKLKLEGKQMCKAGCKKERTFFKYNREEELSEVEDWTR
jgi:hypothetical protein